MSRNTKKKLSGKSKNKETKTPSSSWNRNLQIRLCLYASFLLLGLISITRGSEWLIFIALLPALGYVSNISNFNRKVVLKDFFLGGFLLVVISNLFLLQMASQNWTVALSGWFAYVSRGLALALVASACALGFLLVGFILFKIKNSNYRVFLLVLLWPLAEIIKSYLYALVSLGPGASISPNLNMGAIAVSASGTILVYVSRFVGFFGLTAVVVMINISLYFILFRKKLLWPGVTLFVISMLTIAAWHSGDFNLGKSLNVSVVHLREDSTLKNWNDFEWPPEGTDLLVLPEYSEFLENSNKQQIASRLTDNGVGIHSSAEGSSTNSTNQLQYFNRQAEVINRQDKTFLIPTGEYLPYSLHFSFWALAQDRVIYDFRTTQQIKPGDVPEEPFDTGDLKIGALVCSGVTALSEYRQISRQGADLLTNSASLSFLSENSLYHIYARNMARYHAVSNKKPFIQASRSGESFVMDRQGQIIKLVRGDNGIFSLELSF